MDKMRHHDFIGNLLTRNEQFDNPYVIFARWYYSDRSTRTIPPFSPISIPEHIRSLITKGTLSDLSEAVLLSPCNSLALAHLAISVLAQDKKENANRIQEASRYCFAAAMWDPDMPDVWLAKAQLYREMGPSAEAMDFISKATERFPQRPEIWASQGTLFAAANRWQEAVQAYTTAIKLTENKPGWSRILRKTAFEGRAEAYRYLGERKKADFDLISSQGE